MKTEFLVTLSTDFSQLLVQADDYDVSLRIGEEPHTKIFNAHSVILRARCSYFKAALSSEWTKKNGEMFVFKKPNLSHDIFDVILNGRTSLEQLKASKILDLIIASDELLINELFEHAQEFLINKHSNWVLSNISLVLQTIVSHSSCQQLQSYCINAIVKNPNLLFDSEEFINIEEDMLMDILQRDDFNRMREIDVWSFVLNWGIVNTMELGVENGTSKADDIEKWNEYEFKALSKTIEKLIYHIRFSDISLSDFNSKIKPYSQIFPSSLWNDLQIYFNSRDYTISSSLLPPRRRISSEILSNEHVSILANWIERANIEQTSTHTIPLSTIATSPYVFPYTFRLLYRATREGFDLEHLHKRIGSQPGIIVVAKVSRGNGEIVGGYNPAGWDKSGSVDPETKKSFIFSFKNGNLMNSNNMNNISNSANDTISTNNLINNQIQSKPTIISKISRINPTMVDKVVFDSRVSHICFGGSDLRIGGILNPK
ncbi:3138_t:CDS:2, partial [Scutellospora calospora]